MGAAVSEIVVVIKVKLLAAEQEVAVTTSVKESSKKTKRRLVSHQISGLCIDLWQLVKMIDRRQKGGILITNWKSEQHSKMTQLA